VKREIAKRSKAEIPQTDDISLDFSGDEIANLRIGPGVGAVAIPLLKNIKTRLAKFILGVLEKLES